MDQVTPLSRALTECVRSSRTQKVSLAELGAAAAAADPFMVGDPEWRQRLLSAVELLVTEGLVVLPKNARHYDTKSHPALPAWVMRPAAPRHARLTSNQVWPARLEKAAALIRSERDVRLLEDIRAWLREHPRPTLVPVEERSLQIFDDEKRLSALVANHRMFTSGALELELLTCFVPELPLASEHLVGSGETHLLIAENRATRYSLLEFARSLPKADRPDLHIAWGRGNEIVQSLSGVPRLDPAPQYLWYFGDLDAAGIRAALRSAESAKALGLAPLKPAVPLYRFALEVGKPKAQRGGRLSIKDREAMATWLPVDLATRVSSLFALGQRIAQERVGLERLQERPGLLAEVWSR